MKEWIIDYSIRMIDGEVEEVRETLEARTITEALKLADGKIAEQHVSDPYFYDYVIWGVAIIDDDVFGTDKDPLHGRSGSAPRDVLRLFDSNDMPNCFLTDAKKQEVEWKGGEEQNG